MEKDVIYILGDRIIYPENQEPDLEVSTPRRTKQTNPYSYDPILVWKDFQTEEKANATIYHDRLYMWDNGTNKTDDLMKKHDMNGWTDSAKTEVFLRDYTNNQNLKLIRIVEYCHMSSGYPIWRMDYKE